MTQKNVDNTKKTVKKKTHQQLEIERLKVKYIEYYKDLPVQKYAAMYVGRDEDTINRWRTEDSEFADKVNQARADWVRSKADKAKVEFALERLERSAFGQSVDITTGGEPIAFINKVPRVVIDEVQDN